MTCYVYMIKAGQFVKIGVSENIATRIEQMQTGSPHALVELARLPFESRKAAYAYETELHHRLKKFHFRGEWFHERCIDLGLRRSITGLNYKQKKKGIHKMHDGRWKRVMHDREEMAELEILNEARARI